MSRSEEERERDEDEAYREILKKHNMSLPEDISGVISDLRWAASDNQWYVEMDDGRVYWFSGREGWKLCPQGYPWVTGRFK